jgi:hypothetical protein
VPAACTPASFRFAYDRTNGDISDAAAAAAGKKLALVFVNDGVGATSSTPNPALPGTTISAPTQLSPASTNLINAVAAVNPNTVVVLNTANPVLTPWVANVKGVLESWFAGQEGGTAMARVLLGLANPSGHTALTWPANATDTIWGYNETTPLYPGDSLGQHPERLNGNGGCGVVTGSSAMCPAATQTTETEGIFTGYRFFDKEGITPQFPFGFGLSYTSFRFSRLSQTRSQDGGVDVTFTVKNTGDVPGADAAQVYVGPPSDTPAGIQFAVRSLAQFDRISLNPGQSRTVTLHVPARELSYWSDKNQQWVLDASGRTLWVGDADAPSSLPLSTTLARAHSNISCTNEQFNATTINGNLTVPRGAWCDLVDVTVNGNLKMLGSQGDHGRGHGQGANSGLRVLSSTITGNLVVHGANGASDPLSANENVVCASTIGGNLLVQSSGPASPWNIGGCGANTIQGHAKFSDNAASGNEISGNTIGGDLNCSHNGGISGTGNKAKKLRGQCSTLS